MSAATEGAIAREVVIHGRVQGVFFRAACQREANARAVGGWVRNADDGTVRARFEGAPDDVDALVEFVHQGPQHAQVARVDVTEVDPEGQTWFEVL